MSQESGLQRAPLLDALREELRGLDQQDLLWRIRTLQSPSAPHAKVDGKNVIVLCSNNYLGLANHPKLKQAAIAATRKFGAGSGSVRVIAGTMDLHVRLEKELAAYRGTESSITFQSGYATNLGTITCLVDERDLIISDELNHGSIIDGCRLTKAERRVYKHKDMGDLEKQLQGTERFRRVLIITDGVFSMDGDIAGLKDIGLDTGNSETPITPVIVGEASKARELADDLFKLGVFVLPIVFPMVARDKARVRTIVTSAHTRKDLYTALRAFEKVGKQLALI